MQKLFLAGVFSLMVCLALGQTGIMDYHISKTGWNPDSLGNHRIVVQVSTKGSVAKVEVPWRRRDAAPESKGIIVVDAQKNSIVQNQQSEGFTRSSGTVYFEPTSGPGIYYIYYMPYHLKGTYYPSTWYLPAATHAQGHWLDGIDKTKTRADAHAVAIESVDAFNRLSPMEIIATPAETARLIAKNKQASFLVFPEDRMHPIRMTNDLPYRWIQKGPSLSFEDTADRGENFAFQLGVFAQKTGLSDVEVGFSDLKGPSGAMIQSAVISCINTKGINWTGQPETFKVDIPKGKVQALWCTVAVPEQSAPGLYKGTATIKTADAGTRTVQIALDVKARLAKDHGVDEPWKQTRLAWLNSTLAEKNTVIRPYTPLKKRGDTIDLLGRRVEIAKTGFPAQIESFFTSRMTSIGDSGRKLFTEPVHFHFNKPGGKKQVAFKSGNIQYTEISEGTIAWQVDNQSPELDMLVKGSLEFDGFVNYTVKVTALEDLDLSNISLHLPMVPAATKYMMGLGYPGRQTPDTVDWKWHVATKNQDGAWLGDVNAGLQFSLRDEHYVRPLNTNFYLQQPLLLPVSWGNDGKGGIRMFMKGAAYLVDGYTGARSLKKGDTLYFNFRFLITPFHTLDTRDHFANRYLHKYLPVDSAKELGATVMNIHQGTPINPYINYPFIRSRQMKAYIDSAHKEGIKVKIYNTVRELSDRAYELPALFSLGHEIYTAGKGGGYCWLREHLDQDYIAGWYTPEERDAAIVNSGMSRWHNYYVEGLNWLTGHVGIDGVYLDDVAFDRDIMKRIKRVLTADQHPGLVDLHSASQYDSSDGFINSAMLYMELFPYINRLWFGEKFDYENTSSDYYLTEMSGIPFGLMGEMLEQDGNPWRGMVYGMTDRLLWSATADPRPLWRVWDSFGIRDAEMIGYWATDNPITADNPEVPVTIYQKKGKVLISIASWAPAATAIHLHIDWKALKMNPDQVTLTAPAIEKFQEAKIFDPNGPIPVQPGKGWLLELTQR